jgi:hypothetical protein
MIKTFKKSIGERTFSELSLENKDLRFNISSRKKTLVLLSESF